MSTNTSTKSELLPRSPWGDLASWADLSPWASRMEDLMRGMWPAGTVGDFAPGGELHETDDAFELELDLPGVEKKDITIDVSGRRVRVQGTKESKQREGILRHTSRSTGTFAYEAVLPVPVDEPKVTAKLADGVLAVTLPKADEAKTTHIQIK